MHIADKNFYPKDFKSFRITEKDSNGNALTTIFYADPAFNSPVFIWTKTFDSNDNVETWKINIV